MLDDGFDKLGHNTKAKLRELQVLLLGAVVNGLQQGQADKPMKAKRVNNFGPDPIILSYGAHAPMEDES